MNYPTQIYHSSAKAKYRSPLRALTTGESAVLRLAANGEILKGAYLHISGEGFSYEQPMVFKDGFWQAEIKAPDYPTVIWYYFIVNTFEGTLYYCSSYGTQCGSGRVTSSPQSSFQITVAAKDFRTPDRYKKAVMYQIFPDRFRCGNRESALNGIEHHRSMGRNVFVHESFSDEPLYQGGKDYQPCDYFLGDLEGIRQRLAYLVELGVTALYLNPIFEAASNHRYNTGDYLKIDPVLGDEDALRALVDEADSMGISIILDGVFSHTGSDSRYFNKDGAYDEQGAYQSADSKYHSWYSFESFPDKYRCWWGFETLPEINEWDEHWQEFMLTGENSVLRHWLRAGIGGYRLDVADELPDETIETIRRVEKETSPDALLLGEVWEDATIKRGASGLRRYALGGGLDSVMNYPLRNAIVAFLTGKIDAHTFKNNLLGQCINYPKQMYYVLMNMLSTHDIPRIRTALGMEDSALALTREQQAEYCLSEEQDWYGMIRSRLAAVIIFSLPGMPCIYYGDEVGMTGLLDPFNRRTFRVNDFSLQFFYKRLAQIRHSADALSTGSAGFMHKGSDIIGILRFISSGRDAFDRSGENGFYLTLINRGDEKQFIAIDIYDIRHGLDAEQLKELSLSRFHKAVCELTGKRFDVKNGIIELTIQRYSALMLKLI